MKFLSRKACVLALAFGALALAPTTAQAAAASGPTQCSASFTVGTASSLCQGGTGEHRIVCIYNHHIPGVGPIISNGPWQPVGSTSSTYCPSNSVLNSFIETR